MKNFRLIFLVIILVLAFGGCGGGGGGGRGGDETDITELEGLWLQQISGRGSAKGADGEYRLDLVVGFNYISIASPDVHDSGNATFEFTSYTELEATHLGHGRKSTVVLDRTVRPFIDFRYKQFRRTGKDTFLHEQTMSAPDGSVYKYKIEITFTNSHRAEVKEEGNYSVPDEFGTLWYDYNLTYVIMRID